MHRERIETVSIFYIISLTILFLLTFCNKETVEQPQEKILVNINDEVTISVNEFLRRAEYTIRPSYCKSNSYIHKKIILNSLIAEKLLALEAGKHNPLTENENYQLFIKGRMEQSMRQWMHNIEATKNTRPDSSQIKKYYKFAGREYKITYFTVDDSITLKKSWKKFQENNLSFETFYQHVFGDTTIPTRKITWGNQEHEKILEALYSGNVSNGQVLHPIAMNKNDYLLIKITGWTDNKAITAQQIQDRLKKVNETLSQIETAAKWKKIVGEIMSGKTLDFNKDIFSRMSKLFFQKYFRSSEEKRKLVNQKIWNLETENTRSLDQKELDEISNYPFFSIEGQTWTVEDFNKLLISHPLVYRNKKMQSGEFAKEFRLAIADLMRDYYVTQSAYRKGYDQVNVVQRNVNMWSDAILASYQKEKYLSTLDKDLGNNLIRIIGSHLNKYVDSLQTKYDKKIKLDIDEFEKIQFATIDMLVKQKKQPFQYIVPSFPVLTTDHLIDYLAKLN